MKQKIKNVNKKVKSLIISGFHCSSTSWYIWIKHVYIPGYGAVSICMDAKEWPLQLGPFLFYCNSDFDSKSPDLSTDKFTINNGF